MVLTPVREGKGENSQALAYLDDGMMIVVEGEKRHIGREITTVVTSVLQTSAGRMILRSRNMQIKGEFYESAVSRREGRQQKKPMSCLRPPLFRWVLNKDKEVERDYRRRRILRADGRYQ